VRYPGSAWQGSIQLGKPPTPDNSEGAEAETTHCLNRSRQRQRELGENLEEAKVTKRSQIPFLGRW
jgi:hypothetical protein